MYKKPPLKILFRIFIFLVAVGLVIWSAHKEKRLTGVHIAMIVLAFLELAYDLTD